MELKFKLVDDTAGSSLTHEVAITIYPSAVAIKFETLDGDQDDADGIPVVFEVHNGELRQLQYCFEGGEWVEYPAVTVLLPREYSEAGLE